MVDLFSRLTVMEDVMRNINGYIYNHAGGFHEKYFRTAKWASTSGQLSNLLSDISINSKNSLRSWLKGIQEDCRDELRLWHFTCIDSNGMSAQPSHPDLYLLQSNALTTSIQLEWDQVQVIGNMDDGNAGTYRDTFMRLCQQAQQVFRAQPTRFFLHGFSVHQHKMETWVFDRSGMFGGCPIDIRTDQKQFKICLSGYQLMDDAELGINTFIETDASGLYIMSNESDESLPHRLDLESTPTMSLDQIIGNGIAVYRAKRTTADQWELAVKFKWQLPETDPVRWPGEERMLKLVKERNVWGIARLFNCHYLESINALRKGLQFESPRELINTGEQRREASIVNRSSSLEHQHYQNLDVVIDVAMDTGILTISKPLDRNEDAGGDGKPFTDRILTCMIVSPLGRPLNEFEDVPQLLEAIRDAIRGHKDLHDKGILHQDVSVWNVMIAEARKADGDPKGLLIDLDLALELQSVFPDGRSCAGTPMFMAVEVLYSKHHTYRHDLESFLYVLLWTAICGKSDELPKNSLLQRWRGHDNDQLAATKTSDMGLEGFQNILAEFHADFQDLKPLAWKLRRTLFRTDVGHESLWIGTEEGNGAMEKMYGEFDDAFESSIAHYRVRTDES